MSALGLAVGLTCGVLALANAAGPADHQVFEALRAESSCEMADPTALLTAPLLRELITLQVMAQHDSAKRLEAAAGSYVELDYLVIRNLRQARKFDLADVYRQKCLLGSTASRRAISTFKPGETQVVENYAWVPLIAVGDYFGAGLAFRKQGEHWRYQGLSRDYLGSSPRLDAVLRELHTEAEIDDLAAAQCPMPEAPELSQQLLLTKQDELEAQAGEDGEDYFDERNALAVAMRNSVRFYAEGKQTPPMPIAQMMMAEVLLRSLSFDNAPEQGSALWAARVERAAAYIDAAQARGVNFDRVAPLLGWMSRIYARGIGSLQPDSARAARYQQWAVQWADVDSAVYLQQLASRSINSDLAGSLPRPSKHRIGDLPKEIVACR